MDWMDSTELDPTDSDNELSSQFDELEKDPTSPLFVSRRIVPILDENFGNKPKDEDDADSVRGPSRNKFRPRSLFGPEEDDEQVVDANATRDQLTEALPLTPSPQSSSTILTVHAHVGDLPTLPVLPEIIPENENNQNAAADTDEDQDDESVSVPSSKRKRPRKYRFGSDSEDDEGVNANPDQLTEGVNMDRKSPSTSLTGQSRGNRDSVKDSDSALETSEDESYIDYSSSSHSRDEDPRSSLHALMSDCSVDSIDHYAEQLKSDSSSMKPKRRGTKQSHKPRRKKPRKNKPRRPIGTESSSSSNEDTSTDRDYEAECQEVSIHRISMYKFAALQLETEVEIIEHIVERYNKLNRDHRFLSDHVEHIPEIYAEDEKQFHGPKFEVRIFTQTVRNRIRLFSSFGIRKESAVIHGVLFYYREDEIFALTTGQAYNVVQWCSDYDFPGRVAARLLSEKGHVEITSKNLVGNESSTKKTMKKHQQTNPFALPGIYVSLTAELRENCSLRALHVFKDFEKKKTRVAVSLAAVRIKKRLSPNIFGSILSHFSLIANGNPTFKYSTELGGIDLNSVEQDTEAHLQYLSRVSTEIKNTLDEELCGLIISAIRSPAAMRKLGNFNICHKHFADFFSATKWTLTFNKKEVKTWYTVPTVKDIVNAIPYDNMDSNITRRLERRDENNISRDLPRSELLAEFDKCKISYDTGSGTARTPKQQADKLFDFLEGPLWSQDDGRVYWRVMTQWCSVRDTYLLTVHKQFIRILKGALMKSGDEGFLERPMAPFKREELQEDPLVTYIKKYENTPNYFIWNGTGDNLFDLLYVGEKKEIYLYYLVPALSYKALSMGDRISRAALNIQNACRSGQRSGLTEFYSSFRDSGLKAFFKNIGAFKEAMTKANVVYAVGREEEAETELDGHVTPSLVAESKLKAFIKVQDIRDSLEAGNKDPDVAEAIHGALVAGHYLESTNSITSKLLIAAPHSFNLNLEPRNRDLVDFVFTEIIQKFKSGFNNILLKLDLWGLEKELSLSEKGSKFLICEIPRAELATT